MEGVPTPCQSRGGVGISLQIGFTNLQMLPRNDTCRFESCRDHLQTPDTTPPANSPYWQWRGQHHVPEAKSPGCKRRQRNDYHKELIGLLPAGERIR